LAAIKSGFFWFLVNLSLQKLPENQLFSGISLESKQFIIGKYTTFTD